MNVIPGDFENPKVRALIARHMRGMQENTPAEFVFALDLSKLQTPDISFFAAWEGDELLGIGALKSLGDGTGEIKSMRTADNHLRKGVAARILSHLIAEARLRRYHALLLETGCGDTFEPAARLYQANGFMPCAAFADYPPNDFSQFFRLNL